MITVVDELVNLTYDSVVSEVLRELNKTAQSQAKQGMARVRTQFIFSSSKVVKQAMLDVKKKCESLGYKSDIRYEDLGGHQARYTLYMDWGGVYESEDGTLKELTND